MYKFYLMFIFNHACSIPKLCESPPNVNSFNAYLTCDDMGIKLNLPDMGIKLKRL